MRTIKVKKHNLFQNDINDCLKQILSLLESSIHGKYVLDLGCNEGSKTLLFAHSLRYKSKCIIGADINYNHLTYAKGKNINCFQCNFEETLPIKSESFDAIVSNQVIEHLSDTDLFLTNIHRILKKNGFLIMGTENISYWANIIVMILGYQAFSQNISDCFHVGNPFSVLAGQNLRESMARDTHKRVFSIKGLPALLSKYNFRIENVVGAGFAPLPCFFSRLDKIHSRFIVVKARKT